MAVTNISFDTVLNTDLRDTGGHGMLIAAVTNVAGTYPVGGIIVDPTWFGMTAIKFMNIQSGMAAPYAGNTDPWNLATINVIEAVDPGFFYATPVDTGNLEWRWIVFYNNAGAFEELPDGTQLSLFDGIVITLMVVGA